MQRDSEEQDYFENSSEKNSCRILGKVILQREIRDRISDFSYERNNILITKIN